VASYRFEIGLRDLEIGIGTEVGFSNRRDVEISPFSFVNRLDEIAPPSAGPNHVRFRIQKAQKVGCDSEISLAFRPAVGRASTTCEGSSGEWRVAAAGPRSHTQGQTSPG